MEDSIPPTTSSYAVPVAIIIAGLLIAGAVWFRGNQAAGPTPSQKDQTALLKKLAPVTASDHIRGNLNAKIVIVEYSDLECPFCKSFHKVMQQITTTYKPDEVAWVYRHFPLDNLHPKAHQEAVAAECAAAQGGNDMFWRYVDKIFAITPSNNGLDPNQLPKIAADLGLNAGAFAKCLTSKEFDAKIKASTDNAIAMDAGGTPFSVVITAKGDRIALPGAIPLESMKQLIDQALKN